MDTLLDALQPATRVHLSQTGSFYLYEGVLSMYMYLMAKQSMQVKTQQVLTSLVSTLDVLNVNFITFFLVKTFFLSNSVILVQV